MKSALDRKDSSIHCHVEFPSARIQTMSKCRTAACLHVCHAVCLHKWHNMEQTMSNGKLLHMNYAVSDTVSGDVRIATELLIDHLWHRVWMSVGSVLSSEVDQTRRALRHRFPHLLWV